MEHIIANLDYPELAREKNIEGTVYVEFVVNQKGYVSSVEIVRGPSLLQKAALTVVQSLPGFKPGTNQGKPVNVQYVLPIRFALGE
jgi:TonB family protein